MGFRFCEINLVILTSGTVVSYGTFVKRGALSLISDIRVIIGMFRLLFDDLIVQDTFK